MQQDLAITLEPILDDRELEITSSRPIDWSEDLAWIQLDFSLEAFSPRLHGPALVRRREPRPETNPKGGAHEGRRRSTVSRASWWRK